MQALKLIIALLLATILIAGCRRPSHPHPDVIISPPIVVPDEPTTVPTLNIILVGLHNKERFENGLNRQPLMLDETLCEYAQKHADWMASSNRLRHSSLNIDDYRSLGENIAWNQQTPEEVMEDWMNSGGHRANILGDYNRVGFGYRNDGDGPYWCVVFGKY